MILYDLMLCKRKGNSLYCNGTQKKNFILKKDIHSSMNLMIVSIRYVLISFLLTYLRYRCMSVEKFKTWMFFLHNISDAGRVGSLVIDVKVSHFREKSRKLGHLWKIWADFTKFLVVYRVGSLEIVQIQDNFDQTLTAPIFWWHYVPESC